MAADPAPAETSAALAERIGNHDLAAFEALMRQHNARLFRVARAILKNDSEAEEVVQDAYVAAFRNISQFRGDSQISTWLTRIAINGALMRLRHTRRDRVVVPFDTGDRESAPLDIADEKAESPPVATLRAEIRAILERRIDELPVVFRTVFVMREVEEMSVEDTAACLSIPAATVRTRLFRARALLRRSLARDLDDATVEVFGFAGHRCDRIVDAVLKEIGNLILADRISRGEELDQ